MSEPIDRKYLLAYLSEIKPDEYVSAFGEAAVQVIGLIEEFVKEMPTIEPEVRYGRWIAVSSFDAFGGDEEAWMAHGNPTAYHYCSECKNETYLNEEGKEILSDYCPFCGADMRDGGDDNDSE